MITRETIEIIGMILMTGLLAFGIYREARHSTLDYSEIPSVYLLVNKQKTEMIVRSPGEEYFFATIKNNHFVIKRCQIEKCAHDFKD